MNILVCMKQVPDTALIKIDHETNTLIRKGVPSVINPFDTNAVEAAVQIKEKVGGTVTILTMGPEAAAEAIKECYSVGADKGYLVTDRVVAGSDTFATSYVLSRAIQKIGPFDLIICGKQAIDGDTGQVGPGIAEHLDLAQVTYVAGVEVDGEKVVCKKEHEDGFEMVEVQTPALLTVVKSINEPRYATVMQIRKANKMPVEILTAADLDLDLSFVGLNGSPTRVKKAVPPEKRDSGMIIQADNPEEAARLLLGKLTEHYII